MAINRHERRSYRHKRGAINRHQIDAINRHKRRAINKHRRGAINRHQRDAINRHNIYKHNPNKQFTLTFLLAITQHSERRSHNLGLEE